MENQLSKCSKSNDTLRWKCNVCNEFFKTRAKLQEHKKLNKHTRYTISTKNKILIHFDEIKNKYVSYNELNDYFEQGWEAGGNKIYSQNNIGKCLDPIKEEARRIKISQTAKRNKKSGGARNGAGAGKKGTYKGYYCDSSWELAFVIYNIEHDIEFKRNTQLFEYEFDGEVHKYMPDFIIDDVYYEIKGYWTEQWQAKYDSFKKEHKIEVIDEEKIKPYLDYVIQKYGTNFIDLYKLEG